MTEISHNSIQILNLKIIQHHRLIVHFTKHVPLLFMLFKYVQRFFIQRYILRLRTENLGLLQIILVCRV